MTTIHKRGRIAVAGILAAAALGSAAPAQADRPPTRPSAASAASSASRTRFRQIEERRGWEAASEWWNDHAWPKYYERCVAP